MRTFLKPFSFIPALLLMYMIYSFSAQEGEASSALSYKASYTLVKTADRILDAGLEDWEMQSLATRFHGVTRKLAHMAEYFALAIAVSFPLYVYGLHGFVLMLAAGIICVGFACGDEYHQSFVAGRSPAVKDVLIDSFGVFWGIILVRIVGWTGRKTIFRPVKKKKRRDDSYYETPGRSRKGDFYESRSSQRGYGSPEPYGGGRDGYDSHAFYDDGRDGYDSHAPYDDRQDSYGSHSPYGDGRDGYDSHTPYGGGRDDCGSHAPRDGRRGSYDSPAPYRDRYSGYPSPEAYADRYIEDDSPEYFDDGFYNAPASGAQRQAAAAPYADRHPQTAPAAENRYRRQAYPSFHDAGYTHQEVKEAHVSDKLAEDMSFKKLMRDIREQRKDDKKHRS